MSKDFSNIGESIRKQLEQANELVRPQIEQRNAELLANATRFLGRQYGPSDLNSLKPMAAAINRAAKEIDRFQRLADEQDRFVKAANQAMRPMESLNAAVASMVRQAAGPAKFVDLNKSLKALVGQHKPIKIPSLSDLLPKGTDLKVPSFDIPTIKGLFPAVDNSALSVLHALRSPSWNIDALRSAAVIPPRFEAQIEELVTEAEQVDGAFANWTDGDLPPEASGVIESLKTERFQSLQLNDKVEELIEIARSNDVPAIKGFCIGIAVNLLSDYLGEQFHSVRLIIAVFLLVYAWPRRTGVSQTRSMLRQAGLSNPRLRIVAHTCDAFQSPGNCKIGQVDRLQVVEVIDKISGWQKICYDACGEMHSAWVKSKYLRKA